MKPLIYSVLLLSANICFAEPPHGGGGPGPHVGGGAPHVNGAPHIGGGFPHGGINLAPSASQGNIIQHAPNTTNAIHANPHPNNAWNGQWHGEHHHHHHHHDITILSPGLFIAPDDDYGYVEQYDDTIPNSTVYYFYDDNGNIIYYTYDANGNIIYLNNDNSDEDSQ